MEIDYSDDNSTPYINQIEDIVWDIPPCFERITTRPSPFPNNDPSSAIIIDNGSFECRAGYSSFNTPSISFRSLVAKPKMQYQTSFVVGNKIFDYEQGKIHKKSPFEKNIIAHFGTQEHIFDHIFSHLEIQSENVNHPIVFTEPFCNLTYSRKNITEMLFELYGVPSLTYGVDFLFSLYHNNELYRPIHSDYTGLVISSSYQSTHIVPIINGKIDIEKSRRISIGSDQSRDLLMKSLHLKYPELKMKLTNELVQYIHEHYTMTAIDYEQQLKLLELQFNEEQRKINELEMVSIFGSLEMFNKVYKEENDYNAKIKNQFSYLKSYTNLVEYINNKKEEKEGKFEKKYDPLIRNLISFKRPGFLTIVIPTEEEIKAKQEAKKEQSKRLKELMQKKREENFKNMQIELENLEKIALLKDTDKFQFEEALTNNGYASYEELQKRINKIMSKINTNIPNKEKDIDIEKRWPLLAMPDEDLNPEQMKLKRIQKMQKNAYLSRLEKREQAKKEKEKIEQLKMKSPEKYLISLYRTKKEILDRLEKYKQIHKEMANRHSKSNMKRMQTLAELGSDSTDNQSSAVDDDFGKKDEDWDVYREVSRHNLSDEEEEDQQRLHEIEVQIEEMDPDYYRKYQKYQYDYYRENNYLPLGVDQFRGPELLFKPYIIGVEQAGIGELITQMFKTLDTTTQRKLCGNVFVTGGNTISKNLSQRIEKELRMNMPVDTEIKVRIADDPLLDGWKGGREFYLNEENKSFFITKEEYNEYGNEYLKEHLCGNGKVNKMGSQRLGDLTQMHTVSKKYKI